MSQVVSIRLKSEQAERLKRFARRFGKSQSEMGALFLEEAMREAEFAKIEFQDSALGRQAYMQGSNLAVWEVLMVAQDLNMDAERIAAYFNRPLEWVKAAIHYFEAYPEEIDSRIEENRSAGYDKIKRLLPQVENFRASPETDD
jgi:uncharacterized protein (DUF433 family)